MQNVNIAEGIPTPTRAGIAARVARLAINTSRYNRSLARIFTVSLPQKKKYSGI
jgi:hypothetical protein